MAEHAAPIPLSKRLLSAGALATSILLIGLGVSQVADASAHAAGTRLSCDQNTIYAINSSGAAESIAADTGTATTLKSFSPSNNALGITPNGTYAYATQNATAATSNGTLTRYDPVNDVTTAITGVTVPATTYRGAVDPTSGIYYYAQGNTTKAAVYAYDTTGTGHNIGQVGYIDFAQASTGDFAFSTTGVLYAVSGNQVVRVKGKLPKAVDTTTEFGTQEIAQLGSVTTSPGIAFSTNGYLYVAVGGTIVQINPSSGATVATRTISDGSGNTFTPTDLASCNYADGLSAQSSVNERWKSGDQFSLAITGNGLSYGNTATTTGSDVGLQTATAGSSLVVANTAYTVTQSAAGTTDLANYDTRWSCSTADGTVLNSGSGQTASVTLPNAADNDVSCVFTNTLTAVHVVAGDDTYSTPTNSTLVTPSPGVLANDSGTGHTITGTTQPTHGALNSFDASTGAFSYTPQTDFAGTDSFTYTEQDSSGRTVTPTVTIYVGPTAVADTGTVVLGGQVATTAANGVLANDGGANLTASNASTPAHGTVALQGDGSYTYTSIDDYSGPDTWTYTVTDGGGNTSTGTVTMTITPKAVADTLDPVTAETAVTLPSSSLVGNDVGSNLTLGSVDAQSSAGGTVTEKDDSTEFTYTPKDGFSGTDTFGYTVKDGTGGVGSALATIVVTPVATNDILPALAHGAAATIDTADLLGNDTGSGLRVTGVGAPVEGRVSLSGTTITFTPADDFSGPAGFTYTVTDGTSSTTATVTIPVEPAPGDHSTTATSGEPDVVSAADGVLNGAKGSDLKAGDPTKPGHGDVTMTPDGAYTYTADPTYSGPDSFSYTITDGSGGSTTGTVTVVVLPKAHADTLDPTDDVTPVTIDPATLLQNDNGQGLSIVGAKGLVGGSASAANDGTVTFTPAGGFSGPASFSYTVSDGTNTSTAEVTLDVTPVAFDDTLPSTPVTSPATILPAVFLANDKGADLHIVSVGKATLGTVVLNDDGSVAYSPMSGFTGTYSFQYTVEDSAHQQVTATASIRVTPDAGSVSTSATSGATDSVDAAHGLLSNANGSDLGVALDARPGHGASDGAVALGKDGAFTYTPDPGFSGTDTFGYVVSDPSGGTGYGTVTVTVLPRAYGDTLATSAGSTATVSPVILLSNDKGTGLRVTSVTKPVDGSLTKNDDGTYAYSPDVDFSGTDSFTYTATDAEGNPTTATVTVTVAVAATGDSGVTQANHTLTVNALHGVLADDHGSKLTAKIATPPAHGKVTLATDGSYVFVPATGFSGTDSFVYSATDENGQTGSATVELSTLPTVRTGTVSGIAGSAVHLDTVGVLTGAVGTGLTVTGVGVKGRPGSPITTPLGNTVTIGSDGTFDFVPAAGFSGTETIDFAVTDASHQTVTGHETVTIAPRAFGDSFTTPSNTALAIPTAKLTGNDLGTLLAVTSTTPANGALAHGTLVKQSDGSFVYTPTADFSGSDSFDYTVTDSSGQKATARATIIVGDLAADYTKTVPAGAPFAVSARNGLLSKASGTGLVPKVDAGVRHGTLTIDVDGSYTYVPAKNFSGTDSFTYTVTDDDGQISTGLVTLTVDPTATNDAGKVKAGSTLTLKAPGVLSNDAGSALLVTAVGVPSKGGTATISGRGALVYTPAVGFSGVETIPYTITDQDGETARAIVTVRVLPEAASDRGQTLAGHAITVTAARGLLANDSGLALTAALETRPRHGTVHVNPDGSFTYTPAAGFAGQDSFVYTATDSSGQVTTAKATITVLAVAIAKNDAASGTPGERVMLAPLRNDTATAGANLDPSTVQLLDPSTGKPTSSFVVNGKGTFSVSDGLVTFVPVRNFAGSASIGYQVSDSDDVLVSARITVTYPVAAAAGASAAPGAGAGAGASPSDPSATPIVSVAGTTIGSLAFTGSQGVGGFLLIGLGALLMGLAMLLFRRFRRPPPGPRRTGV